MGAMRILRVINDDVYICIYRKYSDVFKIFTSHAFVYDSHYVQLDKSKWGGEIFDILSYAPICVLEKIYRTIKTTLKNVLIIFLKEVVLLIMYSKLLYAIYHNI